MKPLGMLVIIIISFVLGYSRRSAALSRESALCELAALASSYRANAQFEHESALWCLERFAASERAARLSFLPLALEDARAGELLGDALKKRFLDWRERDGLSARLGAEIADYLSALAAASREAEILRSEYIESAIALELAEVRRENAERRGFYETVYTLAGAAVAIALI